MSAPGAVSVAPEDWHDAVALARQDGFTFFHRLGGVDELGRADEIRVVLRLLRFDAETSSAAGVTDTAGDVCRERIVETSVPRDDGQLATVSDVFVGAAWYEREVHDFFGVVFTDGDQRPLLNHQPHSRTLRKDVPLTARDAPQPGARTRRRR